MRVPFGFRPGRPQIAASSSVASAPRRRPARSSCTRARARTGAAAPPAPLRVPAGPGWPHARSSTARLCLCINVQPVLRCWLGCWRATCAAVLLPVEQWSRDARSLYDETEAASRSWKLRSTGGGPCIASYGAYILPANPLAISFRPSDTVVDHGCCLLNSKTQFAGGR